MEERQPFQQMVLEQWDIHTQKNEPQSKFHILYQKLTQMDHVFKCKI